MYKESDETPLQEAESHTPKFLKTAASKASSLKKGHGTKAKKESPIKRFGGK